MHDLITVSACKAHQSWSAVNSIHVHLPWPQPVVLWCCHMVIPPRVHCHALQLHVSHQTVAQYSPVCSESMVIICMQPFCGACKADRLSAILNSEACFKISLLVQNVHVRSEGGLKERSIRQLSGGERRRVALALALGFADLISGRGQLRCNLIVLDEASASAHPVISSLNCHHCCSQESVSKVSLRMLVVMFMKACVRISTFSQTARWCCNELLISLGVNPLPM